MTVSRSLVRWYCISANAATNSVSTAVRSTSAIIRRQRPEPAQAAEAVPPHHGQQPQQQQIPGAIEYKHEGEVA